jgi:hypothetical protein
MCGRTSGFSNALSAARGQRTRASSGFSREFRDVPGIPLAQALRLEDATMAYGFRILALESGSSILI